jgi:iron only hydrogenase large subunit-like protein
LDKSVSASSRGYAMAGGVRAAIGAAVGTNYTTMNIEGLDKKNIALLKNMAKKPMSQFVEVMACEGGCLNGPCSLAPLAQARRQMEKALG